MAKVDLTKLHSTFSIGDDLGPNMIEAAGPKHYTVKTVSGHRYSIDGNGFKYDDWVLDSQHFMKPVGHGAVRRVWVDANGDNWAAPEIVITNIDAQFRDFGNISVPTDRRSIVFWQVALHGADTISLGNNATREHFYIVFAGDGKESYFTDLPSSFAGDVIKGDLGENGWVSGDVFEVWVNSRGGDDKITLNKSLHSVVLGDFRDVFEDAKAHGGNDRILGGQGSNVLGDGTYIYGRLIAGNDTITGSKLADKLYGDVDIVFDGGKLTGGNDVIHAGGGDDEVYGEYYSAKQGSTVTGGNDKLFGERGNDTIYATEGNDSLDGGAGQDFLSGGAGKDQFRFSAKPGEANADQIVDWVHGADKIGLSKAIFKALGGSVSKAEFVASAVGHDATKANQHLIYDLNEHSLWYDKDGRQRSRRRAEICLCRVLLRRTRSDLEGLRDRLASPARAAFHVSAGGRHSRGRRRVR